MIYRLLKPALFALDPEAAHALSLAAIKPLAAFLRPARIESARAESTRAGRLAVDVAGLRFPNPLGMAAGYDKDAEVPDALLALGFGFAEVGSITPLAQAGNPRPRLFRLVEDRAVINRMGFNNAGGAAAAARLAARRARGGIVGVNLGANKDSADKAADYAAMAALMAPLASYLAVNVSSPNTPGLRALQDPAALSGLLDEVIAAARGSAGAGSGSAHTPPIFLKVAPDLTPADIDAIARIAVDKRLGALIVANTTISRPVLVSPHGHESGGLSGAPLRALALRRLRDFRDATGGAVPLIGVGGIASADDAWERIRAGASLVQLYSAMVYEGPGIARRIVRGIEKLMAREGFATIAEAAAGA